MGTGEPPAGVAVWRFETRRAEKDRDNHTLQRILHSLWYGWTDVGAGEMGWDCDYRRRSPHSQLV
jgi:hypothetical protein